MNRRLFWQVARWEFRLLTRGFGFWLAVLGGAAVSANLVRNGITSPQVVADGLTGWILPVVSLVLLPGLGSVRRRDEAMGVQELIHSRPVGTLEWILGKFAAGWAVLITAWLLCLAVAAAVTVVIEPDTLGFLPGILGLSGLLVLTPFALVTALCLAVDAVAGRAGAVMGVGAAVILGSVFTPVLNRFWSSLLMPVFMPTDVGPVFGYEPYAGVVMATRGWTLALALALLAAAVRWLPRRTPVLEGGAAGRAVAALVVAALVFGVGSAAVLARVPAPLHWRAEARTWELARVREALAGDPQSQRYWHRYDLAADPWPVAVWVARGAAAEVAALGAYAVDLLPHFPALQPPPGDTFHLFQGQFLDTPRTESGALVVLPKDVRLASTEYGRRALLRAMADAHWVGLIRLPPDTPLQPVPLGLPDTWAQAASLYHQWVVLDRTDGREAVTAEQALWQRARADAELRVRSDRDASDELFGRGIVGYYLPYTGAAQALALWRLGEEVGHRRVLAALEEAARRLSPARFEVWWEREPGISGFVFRQEPADTEAWEAVSQVLGIDVQSLPYWPRFGPPASGR